MLLCSDTSVLGHTTALVLRVQVDSKIQHRQNQLTEANDVGNNSNSVKRLQHGQGQGHKTRQREDKQNRKQTQKKDRETTN